MAPLAFAVLWLGAGILIGLLRPAPMWGGPFFIAASLAAAVVALLLTRSTLPPGLRRAHGHRDAAVYGLVLTAGVLLGLVTRTADERSCQSRVPAHVALLVEGTVHDVGAPSRGAARLVLAVDRFRAASGWVECGGALPARMDTGAAPLPVAGSVVRAVGRWWSPPGAGSGLGRPGLLLLDSVAVVEARTEGVPAVPALRRAIRSRIDAIYPEHGELVASLLLAQRDGLDRDVRDRYARAGLSHLLAISGLHVGLVAGILLLLAGTLRVAKGTAAGMAAAGTVAYVAFLGAPHSAARAALQIVLVLAARGMQRPTRTASLIAAAALVLLALEPGAVVQPGFQLSFAGVAGILALRGPLTRTLAPVSGVRILRWRFGRWLADGLATSLAATLATAPIVAWHFGRVAPIGILANLIAIPLLGLAVPALALALAVGSVWLRAGQFLAAGGALMLDGIDHTAAVAASVPGGTVAVPASAALGMTAAVGAGYFFSRRLGRVRVLVRGVAWTGVAGAVLMVAPLRPASDRVEIHVIDVGQGDAIGIRSPAGRWLLVDAGVATRSYDAGEARVVPYLARRGVSRLEGLILTHADADHMGGASSVMAALRPRWVGDPGAVVSKDWYLELLRSAAETGMPWVALGRGVELSLDGMNVAFLYPDGPGMHFEDANDGSLVLRVEYGAFSALLTGDAPAAVEEALVKRHGSALEAEVLKAGHHGSATSTTSDLISATGARDALISAGRGNRYGHPHASVLGRLRDRGVRIHRTDTGGTLVVKGTADGHVTVETDRQSANTAPSRARNADSPG